MHEWRSGLSDHSIHSLLAVECRGFDSHIDNTLYRSKNVVLCLGVLRSRVMYTYRRPDLPDIFLVRELSS